MENIIFKKAVFVNMMLALRGNSCGVCGDPGDKTKPVYLTSGESFINSGINGVIAKHCSVDFADINDPAEWEALATDPNPLLIGRGGPCGRVTGTKPVGTPNYAVTGACGREDVISTTRTFTITDNGNDALLSVDNFWCFLLECRDEYEVAFTTCDGRMYPFQSVTKFFADTVETGSNDDIRVWEATWEFKTPRVSCQTTLIPAGLNDQWNVLQLGAAGLATTATGTGRRTTAGGSVAGRKSKPASATTT